jgi:hypothetical protein
MNPNSPLAPSPLLKDEPASGLDYSGDFKAAPDIRSSGPAAGGGYVLRAGPKVKVAGTEGLADRLAGGRFDERPDPTDALETQSTRRCRRSRRAGGAVLRPA